MQVIESWKKKGNTTEIIIELEDHSLYTFCATPGKYVTEKDLQPYIGKRPNKKSSAVVSGESLKNYGIEKLYKLKQETINITLSPIQKEMLEQLAEREGISMSKCVHGMINLYYLCFYLNSTKNDAFFSKLTETGFIAGINLY